MLNVKLSTFALVSVLVSTQIISCGKSKKSSDDGEESPVVEVTSSQPQENPPKAETPAAPTPEPAPAPAPAPAPVPAPVPAPDTTPAPQALPVFGTWLGEKITSISTSDGQTKEWTSQAQLSITAESLTVKLMCSDGVTNTENERTAKASVTETHIEILEDFPFSRDFCEPAMVMAKIPYQFAGSMLLLVDEESKQVMTYHRAN